MKLALFYDTETTGLPLFREPSEDPRQPHLVQLGAQMVDMETRKIIQTIDLIVRPDDWVIPDEVAEIHGITTEIATGVGIDESLVLATFLDMWKCCEVRIGHNEAFDARLIRIAISRHDSHPDDMAEQWKNGQSECTCNLSTPIVNLPPTEKMLAKNMRGPKKANLQEAYKHFHGKEFEGEHSAITDVNACMQVYFAINDQVDPS